MHTPLCDRLGIEFPIFAFTHCRDVVAAVSKAGGLGVLGAVGFSPEQLEIELNWIDDNVNGMPYGVDTVLGHPIKLIANALGSPPKDVIDRAHEHGVKVAALAGKAVHAQRHVNNGVDIVVAQGYEAGGHTGEIATMVLVPEVVDAVAPAPVLAAGGIGSGRQIAAALSLGAQGVWLGSLWMTTAESDMQPLVVEK